MESTIQVFVETLNLHQENLFWPLGVYGCVWELSNQNPRVVKSRQLLDWCSGLPVYPGAPRCANYKPGSTWEHLQQAWEHLKASATSLGALTTSLGAARSAGNMPGSTNHKPGSTDEPGSTSNQCRPAGRIIIFFANAAGAPGNHSYYLLFNIFWNSCI